MYSLALLSAATVSFATLARAQDNPCKSFGVDFQSDGTYFQNSLSSDPFTAVQSFSGCTNDTANNFLVAPNGDQSQCTDTPLQPDDTPETVTCSAWPKNKLTSGAWSLIIMSNNGDGQPIAYQRDFSLIVGPQQTTTVIPTVTVNATSTPIITGGTFTSTLTSTLPTPVSTKTCLLCLPPLVPIIPLPKIVFTTKALKTITSTSTVAIPTNAPATYTAVCSHRPKNTIPDPFARFIITLPHFKREAEPTPAPYGNSAKFLHHLARGEQVAEEAKQEFIREREARIAKRAPDSSVVTVTNTDTALYSTMTNDVVAEAVTVSQTAVVTQTITPAAVTVTKNLLTIPTILLPPATITQTILKPFEVVYATSTHTAIVPVTSTIIPPGAASACASEGGVMV